MRCLQFIFANYCYGFFTPQVFTPTIAYNGQKLINAVAANTPPSITRTNPNVPATVPLK